MCVRPRVDAEAALAADARRCSPGRGPRRRARSAPRARPATAGAPTAGRRRRCLRLLAQQQLAGDQPGLDRLAEADVVGDEEVDAREPQRLAQRLDLVGVDLDAGAERRLEEARVGRGDAVPAERVQVGRELARVVEALGGEVVPAPPPRGCAGRARTPRGPRAPGPGRRRRRRRGGRAASRRPSAARSTSSTSQRRERTWTSSPGSGARSGRASAIGISVEVGTRTRCRASEWRA